jgi:hypothetical protein
MINKPAVTNDGQCERALVRFRFAQLWFQRAPAMANYYDFLIALLPARTFGGGGQQITRKHR